MDDYERLDWWNRELPRFIYPSYEEFLNWIVWRNKILKY